MLSRCCARSPRLVALTSVALLALVAATPPALAQRYKADAVEARLSSKGVIARRYVKQGSGDQQEFRDYLLKYFFPAMTQPTPEGLADLGKLQGDLFKYLLYPAQGATQKYVHEQSLKFAKRVLRDSGYHPSVRYNALLILGKLDDKYPTGDQPPVPSAEANDLLCALVNRGLTNSRAPRYELVGALEGIERQTRFFADLPNDQKRNTYKALYQVLSAEKLEGEYGRGVRDWVYLQAATAVGNLGTVGPRGLFAIAISKRLEDDARSLDCRAAMAAQLERMNPKAGEFESGPVVEAVIGLANTVSQEEAETARTFEDLQIGGGPQRVVSGRDKLSRRITEGQQDRGPMLVREGIVALLVDLRRGVRAAKTMAAEADQARLATIDEAVGDAIGVASNKGAIDLNVTDAIKRMAASVKSVASAEPLAAAE